MRLELAIPAGAAETKLVDAVEARIQAALRERIQESAGFREVLLWMSADTFDVFELSLQFHSFEDDDDENELLAELAREGGNIRAFWSEPNAPRSQSFDILQCGERESDRRLLYDVREFWDESGIDDKFGYRLWELIAKAASDVRFRHQEFQHLPWILEDGVNDHAPKSFAILLNPEGQAEPYLKQVWGPPK